MFVLGGLAAAGAQEIRYANGAPVRGTLKAVTAEGVEMDMGGSSRSYPWAALSAGTRFRHDPHYRANLAAAQAGQPKRAWTQPPEEGSAGGVAPGSPPAGGAPGSTAAVPMTVGPLDLSAYDVVPPLARGGIPRLELRHPESALSWGLRFGKPVSDVVYLVFDPKEAGDVPESLILFAPTGERVDRIKATRRTEAGEPIVLFRKLRYHGTHNDASASIDLTCQFSSRQSSTLIVDADVELARGETRSSFRLVGAPAGTLRGDGDITARPLLEPPGLWLTADVSSGKPVLVGNVRMGRLKLLPKRGMGTEAAVTVLDDAGKVVLETTAAAKAGSAQDRYTISVPLDRLAAGRKYSVKASMDLGPLLGTVRYEEGFVLP